MGRAKHKKMKKILLIFSIVLVQSNLTFAQRSNFRENRINKLFSKANYTKAIEVLKKDSLYFKNKLGTSSAEYATCLNNLGVLYSEINEYRKAESLYLDALVIRKNIFGELHLEVALVLNNLAILYEKINDFGKSKQFYLQALDIRKKLLGEENNDYLSTIDGLINVYRQTEEYKEAELLCVKSLEIQKKISGIENSQYALFVNTLANIYREIGKYDEAELQYLLALEIQKKISAPKTLNYAYLLDDLSSFYSLTGKYEMSEKFAIESINIIKNIYGEKHIQYASSLFTLACTYKNMGHYHDAEELCKKVIEIRKDQLGEANLDYAYALNILGLIYAKKEEYDKAEPIWIKVLEIRKKISGEINSDYAISLNNLAEIYNQLGNYSKAETYFKKSIEISKSIYGEENTNNVPAMSNLAGLYRLNEKYGDAELLLKKVVDINKKYLGEKDIDFLTSLNNLGLLYSQMGDYTKSEELLKKCLSISKEQYGEKNKVYISSMHNLAGLYEDMGKSEMAISLYAELLEIKKNILGEDNLDYAESLINSAYFFDKINDFKQASFQYSSALKIFQSIWGKNISFLNSTESDIFINSKKHYFDIPLSFLARHPHEMLKDDLLNFNIFIKNVLLNRIQLIEKFVSNNPDSSIKSMWSNYKSLCFEISNNLQNSISEPHLLTQLKAKSDSIEKVILNNIPQFDEIINNKVTWKDIRTKLKYNEASVDFVSFSNYNHSSTDTILYAAFIIRPGWEHPQFINLFNEDQLDSLFDSSNTSYSINNLYCGNNGAIDSTCNTTLYNLIWHPIDSLLNGVKKVFISPSGLLNRVSFSAIPTPEGGQLINRYSIEQFSNIRTIAETNKSQEDTLKSMVLIGGANFDVEPTFSNKSNINYVSTDTLFSEIRSLHGSKWSYLAGTENEVSAIKNIASPNKMSLSLLTGSNASEENFKKIGSANEPAPSVIHIATHGFAFATPKKIPKEDRFLLQDNRTYVFRISEDPLTRAGLVMAGGNQVWSTGIPYPNHEDGILTAREVSEMNLKGCVLATLSACETGLGEIKGSEGVFGLQRAFKMAGVKYLIVSLWKVPDAQTKEFMELFYSSWLNQKLPIREAFRQTQIYLSKKYPPYQWAAFVLVE